MKLAARGHLKDLTRSECLELLPTVSVGRLAVSIRALPAVLPVNFCLHDGQIIFRTVPGSKLDAATTQAVVAFQADNYEPSGAWGWSVLVQGIAEEVTQPDELVTMRSLRLSPWAYPSGEASRFVRIETEVVSGRRFRRSAAFST